MILCSVDQFNFKCCLSAMLVCRKDLPGEGRRRYYAGPKGMRYRISLTYTVLNGLSVAFLMKINFNLYATLPKEASLSILKSHTPSKNVGGMYSRS